MNSEEKQFKKVIKARKRHERRLLTIRRFENKMGITPREAVIRHVTPTPRKSLWRRLLRALCFWLPLE